MYQCFYQPLRYIERMEEANKETENDDREGQITPWFVVVVIDLTSTMATG